MQQETEVQIAQFMYQVIIVTLIKQCVVVDNVEHIAIHIQKKTLTVMLVD